MRRVIKYHPDKTLKSYEIFDVKTDPESCVYRQIKTYEDNGTITFEIYDYTNKIYISKEVTGMCQSCKNTVVKSYKDGNKHGKWKYRDPVEHFVITEYYSNNILISQTSRIIKHYPC